MARDDEVRTRWFDVALVVTLLVFVFLAPAKNFIPPDRPAEAAPVDSARPLFSAPG